MLSTAIAFFVLGLVWVTLFPLCNISSGESKPRSLYVDENAFVVNNVQIDEATYSRLQLSESLSNDLLREICSCQIYYSSFHSLENNQCTCHFHNPRESEAYEAIILILPYNVFLKRLVILYASRILTALNYMKWLSKHVIVLMLENNESIRSSLERWIKNYHRQIKIPFQEEMKQPQHFIREAFILDIFNFEDYFRQNETISFDTLRRLSWRDIEISYYGTNGQLPNMDIISSALALDMNLLTVGDTHLQIIVSNGIISTIIRYVIEIFPESKEYLNRLFGLFHSVTSMVNGSDGLHGQLLHHNIDAITLRPRQATLKKHTKTTLKKRIDVDFLVSLSLKVLRMYSNLHGKR
jgi:hypothetical protein